MKFLKVKLSWLFLLIPIGVLVFVIIPEAQIKYTTFNNKQIAFQQDVDRLDSLKRLAAPKKKDLYVIKKLETILPIHERVYQQELFLYYKTGGMLFVLVFMRVGMIGFSYISRKKKSSSKNKKIDFTFGNPEMDIIGQQIPWGALEESGSNFASEVLKKTINGYKITSSSFTKVFVWSFLLIGLNYMVISFVEFYQIHDVPLTLMKGGKIFFTSGGIFLLIGLILVFMFSPKVYVNTQKRKVIVDGEILTFKQIYALQVLEKFIEGNSSGSYLSYELNIITHNGDRYNLLNHGDKDYMLSDMIKLSSLFKVPVWNRGVV